MNLVEINDLFVLIRSLDNRKKPDDLTIRTWQRILANVSFADAQVAVAEYFTHHTDFLMPAHIVEGVKLIREERARRVPHEVRELPGRFEPSEARAARLEHGIAQCRDAIGDTLDATARKVYDYDDPRRDAAIRRARLERRQRPARSQPGAIGNVLAQVAAGLTTTRQEQT